MGKNKNMVPLSANDLEILISVNDTEDKNIKCNINPDHQYSLIFTKDGHIVKCRTSRSLNITVSRDGVSFILPYQERLQLAEKGELRYELYDLTSGNEVIAGRMIFVAEILQSKNIEENIQTV